MPFPMKGTPENSRVFVMQWYFGGGGGTRNTPFVAPYCPLGAPKSRVINSGTIYVCRPPDTAPPKHPKQVHGVAGKGSQDLSPLTAGVP